MSRTKTYSLFFLGVASALGMTWLVRRIKQNLNTFAIWQRTLAEKHGAGKAQDIIERARQRNRQLIAERPLPENPILRGHLTGNILPGLALYQILLQEYSNDQQAALADVDRAFRAQSLAKSRGMVLPLKVLPNPWGVFKLAFNRVMKSYPGEGWDWEYLENSDERIAFNGTRCFYLDTLKNYGAPELTASFCKTDDVMAELFPPPIRFVREHTLGRGDAVCDFQYYHIQ